MRCAAAWFIAASACLTLQIPAQAADPAKPNVLFFAIDDLNDWIGCLGGHPQAQTPHMDALAQRGTLFTNAHCQAPLCNPTRASILTGLRPSTTGVYALAPWFRTNPDLADYVTLPQELARHGYRTLSGGKIYHDAYPPPEGRVDGAEFDVWGYHGNFGPRPDRKFVETPDKILLMDWGVFPERDDQQEDYKVASWAIDQIRAGGEQPFFLCVGLRRPHVPCYASQSWFDLYPEENLILPPVLETDRDDLPAFASYLHWKLPEPRLKWLRANDQWKPLVRSYLACVSFVDAQVGRVVAALDQAGLADNTIVVLWSDHGWHLGEKLISGKNTLWEPSTRVPFIMTGPGVTPSQRCGQPVELLDIFPTLLDLCGLPPRTELEGHSLAPQLRDAATPRPWPAITTHNQGNHTVRTDRWRYIRYADGSEELYDMLADPEEWTNRVADPSLAAIRAELARWLPTHDHPPLPGSAARILTYANGQAVWEGTPIEPGATLPD